MSIPRDQLMKIDAFHNNLTNIKFRSKRLEEKQEGEEGALSVLHAGGEARRSRQIFPPSGLTKSMALNAYSLISATRSGSYEEVCSLIEGGIDINTHDVDNDDTPLHIAVQCGHTNIVRLLLEKGAEITSCQSDETVYPIHVAARYGHLDIIELLLENGSSIDSRTDEGSHSIHFAAEGNHVDVINYFLERGAAVDDMANKWKSTPLSRAASSGSKEAVECLLEKKANVNQTDVSYFTPLHWASEKEDIVELLIEKRAKLDEKTENGWTCLHFAAQAGNRKSVRLLLEAGAACKFTGAVKGFSPLHLAAQCNNIEVLQCFLEKGADINIRTSDGFTLLHIAARHGRNKLVDFLLNSGIDINSQTNSKKFTSLHFAARYRNSDSLELLLQNGADFERKDWRGLTPLEIMPKYFNPHYLEYDQSLWRTVKVIIKYMLLHNKNVKRQFCDYCPFFRYFTTFCEECNEEVHDMKEYIFGDTSISLYTFLRDSCDTTKLTTYLCNEDLRQEFKNLPDYSKSFTIYANISTTIEAKMQMGLRRLRLLEEANYIMEKITPILPIECRYKIFSFLDESELKNFIKSVASVTVL